ncbi:DHH phosphoesterase [Boletus reticuloceps]|uniref:DHH phosphoesterase n=1 Tax=Boletus reticuloceps TaxID=495285 RepID=A0A8I2YVQ1_9AGAM|nr:DHH phosphoesterase [Boletus reticuloceps]
MTTTSGLSAYLLEQKTRFLGDNGDSWTVVMGNEAGDLDSLASSIGFAWFLSHKPNADANAIALITTPREDFVLRAENLYALQLVGIKEDIRELLYHNSLHPTYALPDVRVTSIIDHHEDEGKYLDTASPRSIEPAGSCASLVTRVIMSYPTLQIPPELATLLLNAIVIDTHGLRRGGKAVGVDYEAFTWLVPRANVPSSGSLIEQMAETPQHIPDLAWVQSLAHTLNTKKTALSHLNTRDLLRRDYKEYIFNLSSSIRGDSPCSVKAGLSTEWIKERGLSILGVLTTYKSKQGKPKRKLMWVVDEKVCGPRLPQVLFDGIEASEILQVKRTDFERYGFNSQVGRDKKERDEVERGSID